MYQKFSVIIIGAGAAGLMCAKVAGKRNRQVLVLDKSNKPGKKILMSGGGRCNFTNTQTTSEQFISNNPHFCKSALSRYTQWDFIDLVNSYKIQYYEKTLGQLFCKEKSINILDMLLNECMKNNAQIKLKQTIDFIKKEENFFVISANNILYQCESVVIATGGLSIPTLGSSPYGYQVAKQFGLKVHNTRAGLVPFTLHEKDKQKYSELSGISVECEVSCRDKVFRENILFTHRGLSGPAILQISSYWQPGDEVTICALPDVDLRHEILELKKSNPDIYCRTVLTSYFAKKLVNVFINKDILDKPIKQLSEKDLVMITSNLQSWSIKPNATEGYRTAEVTLGGVDCNELSSKTFEAHKVPGLYFIGEVIDVSGWLGGYNFQWAWSSGWAAGQIV
ncbi:MAG: NAD(P)/FAD-dependent oxidoreductase [Legionellaceae bacterium]|nr:NAD(P)/FAD-dependent oxidoreductase [Legionellaceae bacterium]